MEGAYNSRTPEEVFRDFRARRAGIVKALTTGKFPLRSCFL
jgi:Alfin